MLVVMALPFGPMPQCYDRRLSASWGSICDAAAGAKVDFLSAAIPQTQTFTSAPPATAMRQIQAWWKRHTRDPNEAEAPRLPKVASQSRAGDQRGCACATRGHDAHKPTTSPALRVECPSPDAASLPTSKIERARALSRLALEDQGGDDREDLQQARSGDIDIWGLDGIPGFKTGTGPTRGRSLGRSLRGGLECGLLLRAEPSPAQVWRILPTSPLPAGLAEAHTPPCGPDAAWRRRKLHAPRVREYAGYSPRNGPSGPESCAPRGRTQPQVGPTRPKSGRRQPNFGRRRPKVGRFRWSRKKHIYNQQSVSWASDFGGLEPRWSRSRHTSVASKSGGLGQNTTNKWSRTKTNSMASKLGGLGQNWAEHRQHLVKYRPRLVDIGPNLEEFGPSSAEGGQI